MMNLPVKWIKKQLGYIRTFVWFLNENYQLNFSYSYFDFNFQNMICVIFLISNGVLFFTTKGGGGAGRFWNLSSYIRDLQPS